MSEQTISHPIEEPGARVKIARNSKGYTWEVSTTGPDVELAFQRAITLENRVRLHCDQLSKKEGL